MKDSRSTREIFELRDWRPIIESMKILMETAFPETPLNYF